MEGKVKRHLYLLQHSQTSCWPPASAKMDPLTLSEERKDGRGVKFSERKINPFKLLKPAGVLREVSAQPGIWLESFPVENLPWIHWFNLYQKWVCSFPYIPTAIAIPLSGVSWESLFACFPESVVFPFFSFLFAQRCDYSLPLWGFHSPGETSQSQHCLAWYLSNVHVNFQ